MELSYIIVAAGQDLSNLNHPRCLHLCARTGNPQFLSPPPQRPGDILGLCEGGSVSDIRAFCDQLCTQAAACGAIFADLEDTQWTGLIAALDSTAYRKHLTCYVPLCMADAAPHSILTVSTAISGGSLRQYFQSLLYRHGKNRIAALLEYTSMRFRLPSDQSEGELLDSDAREQLRHKHDSTIFFSSELCANYFTYGDESGSYFVLFDDKNTFLRKLELLESIQITDRFVLYPDAETFFLPYKKEPEHIFPDS